MTVPDIQTGLAEVTPRYSKDGLPSKHSIAPTPKPDPKDTLDVKRRSDEDDAMAVTRTMLAPEFHSSRVAAHFGKSQFCDHVTLMSLLKTFQAKSAKLAANDLSDVEANLMAQAISLDVMFSELARRAANNIDKHFEVMERYLKLALKAQNQSRMTLETLANVKNPPVVYAKQANINNGGQQQVTNGTPPRTPATETEIPPNKLVEAKIETPMDTGTTGQAGQQYSSLATMDTLNRAKVT